ncbi:MAG: porin [Alphaproteobacteria bacterium]
MKKALLFGTTALVAAGLVATDASAKAFEVEVGGFMEQWVGVADNDIDSVQTLNQWSDTEIHFTGETTLDNGVTVGINVQLEGNTSGDQIDESFAYIEGDFGRVNLGSENSAPYLMQRIAPNYGMPINSGDVNKHLVGFGGGLTTRGATTIEVGGDNDGQKITYFTPVLGPGFRLGVSVTPDIDTTGGDINVARVTARPFDWGLSAGAEFVNSTDMFEYALTGGIYYGDEAGASEDFLAYSAGVNLKFGGGFEVGGSVAWDDTDSNASGTEGVGYDLGIGYMSGPWGLSLTYFGSDMEAADMDQTVIQGSVMYQLGTGVSLAGSIGYGDDELVDNDGYYGTGGLILNF